MNSFEKLSLVVTALIYLRVHCSSSIVQSTCAKDQFRCDNGQCIEIRRMCDGFKDCSDWTDEVRCWTDNFPKCPKSYFQCISTRRCVLYGLRCDSYNACDDGSDEQNCVTPVCGVFDEFECLKNRQCVPLTKRCNGEFDCDDGSDELVCGLYAKKCVNHYFPCENNAGCIPREWLCDGDNDCENGSDEKYCVLTTVVPVMKEESCPDNYCMHNANCVVIRGQYHCNCSSSYTGEKCEKSISFEFEFHGHEIIIGISMTLISLLIMIALMLFYYFKRRSARHSTELMSENESQAPVALYSNK